jgi:hypothetical protein
VAEIKGHVETSNPQLVAVPFLLWYSRVDVPFDTAIYNDQLLICDSNGDGFISTQEAAAFREMARAKATDAESKTADKKSNSLAQHLPPGTPIPPGVVR